MQSPFCDSIAFFSYRAESLNTKIKDLSPLLYVFCYYTPRPFREDVSASVNFWTAVINTHALLNDCFPFRKKEELKKTFFNGYYSWFNGVKEFINWLRGMYCHNNAREDGDGFWKRNRKRFCAEKVLKSNEVALEEPDYDVLDKIPYEIISADKILETEKDWVAATKVVCALADRICEIIGENLKEMITENDQNTIRILLLQICDWTTNDQYMRLREFFTNLSWNYVNRGYITSFNEAMSKWYWEKESKNALWETACRMIDDASIYNLDKTLFPNDLLIQLILKCKYIEKNNSNGELYPIKIEIIP